jgi:hypothetical protein
LFYLKLQFDFSVLVDLGSFQVFGISTDSNQSELSNDSRPVLAKPSSSSTSNQEKLLQVEFETNPLDKKSDYRVKIISQSLEIKYNAVRNIYFHISFKYGFYLANN